MSQPYTPRLSLAPSSASTWMRCNGAPGYVLRNWHRVPKDDTVWSAEGDHAHAVAESVLKGQPVPRESKKGRIPLNKLPEMLKYGNLFKAHCLGDQPIEWESERKVNLFYMPGRDGLVDFSSLNTKKVRIVDLKYGVGVSVSAEDNEQLAIYARSYIDESLLNHWLWPVDDDTVIELEIWQPRVREGDQLSTWTLTWKELRDFTDNIAATARKIQKAEETKEELPLVPGRKQCQFCKAKTFCEAKNGKTVKAVASVVPALPDNTMVFPDPATLTEEQIMLMLRYRSRMKSWLDEIYKLYHNRGIKGGVPPGFKWVRGKGSSGWKDRDLAVLVLSMAGLEDDDIEPKGIISPNQAKIALKALGASRALVQEVTGMVSKFPGKPVLAPLEDERPSLQASPADLMDFIEDDEDLDED